MIKKKVAIIGTVGLPSKYGGFETLAEQLVRNLKFDFNFLVFCSAKSYPNRELKFEEADLEYIPLNANGVQSIPYDILSILKAIRKADTLLILGVSGVVVLPVLRLFSKKKMIVHLDGLEWRRDKWNWLAKKYLKFSEWIGVKYADNVIADNAGIRDYLTKEYNAESVLITYGGDHALTASNSSQESERYAFTVCRIEPENNIHKILEAFRQQGKMKLKIVGNWTVSEYAEKLRKDYGSFDNIELIDPIYDMEKLNSIRANCHIYVHGHSAGGTNPSLVEAMHLGLPVIAYDVVYNRESTLNDAIYFNDTEELVSRLNAVEDQVLNSLRLRMKDIADTHYTWAKITNQYKELLK
ncbi:DUF1972 domain-containing protein [Chitinophaga sp. Cy-1792]|uniref:DUF1972 domain-containing protein n=1 Tax=Chitinophaga sp. Cy-1792 TaxID=2608339 RepID=UPI0014240DA9|nr:DUF1972 domain-containing protein [Chitinophaga sp. Cy-1792]NIG52102.1 glycosyltransferase family 1 protein [Chitinophaga sp. Cy-1792]